MQSNLFPLTTLWQLFYRSTIYFSIIRGISITQIKSTIRKYRSGGGNAAIKGSVTTA